MFSADRRQSGNGTKSSGAKDKQKRDAERRPPTNASWGCDDYCKHALANAQHSSRDPWVCAPDASFQSILHTCKECLQHGEVGYIPAGLAPTLKSMAQFCDGVDPGSKNAVVLQEVSSVISLASPTLTSELTLGPDQSSSSLSTTSSSSSPSSTLSSTTSALPTAPPSALPSALSSLSSAASAPASTASSRTSTSSTFSSSPSTFSTAASISTLTSIPFTGVPTSPPLTDSDSKGNHTSTNIIVPAVVVPIAALIAVILAVAYKFRRRDSLPCTHQDTATLTATEEDKSEPEPNDTVPERQESPTPRVVLVEHGANEIFELPVNELVGSELDGRGHG